MTLQGSGDFGHLHQAQHPLLHASPPGGTHDQQRKLALGAFLHQTGDFFPHHRTHRTAHEAEIHHRQTHTNPVHAAKTGDHTIVQSRRRLALSQTVCVGTTVFKSQRVDGSQMLIQVLKALGISDQSKPLGAVDAVVIPTTRTDTGIQAKVLEINNKTALWALAPKAIALFGFLFDIADVLTFTAVSKPVEKGHTNRSVRSIKDPAMA